MLQSIRDNSQSIVAKVIVGLIIVTFALFGVESLVSLSAGSNAPATVNGEEITEQELYQATELQRRQLLSQMGENADPALLDENLIRGMVLESLIQQKSLLLSAQEQKLLISDRMIDQLIVNTPDFQIDGKFNPAQFEAVLRNAGFSPMMYRELVKKEKLLEQQRTAYELSAFAVPSELERIVELDRQTRNARYFVLPKAEIEKTVGVSDDEIKARYEQDKANLTTEEQVVVEYVVLNKNDLRDGVSVSEEEINGAYDQMLATFQAEEQRHSAHILIEVSDTQDDAAALAKITALKQRIDAGETFDAVAKSDSEDLGSAETGGDLGVNGKGVFATAFEDALFSMNEGEVSEPVRTEFGYHLIKLLDISSKEAPTLAQVREQLTEDLVSQKVEAVYVEKLETLADVSFSSGDLVEPSEVLGLTILTSAPFDRSGGEVDITRNAKVISAAFSQEQIKEGLNSAPIELDRERTVVVRVKEHFEPRSQTLEEVADSLKEIIKTEKVLAALKADAEQRKADLLAGKPVDVVAADLTVESVEAASRAAAELPAEVRSLMFAMPHPTQGQPSIDITDLADGGMALVLLDKVNTEAVELSEEEKRSMGGFLSNRIGQQDYQAFVDRLKNTAVIEKL
ncbi:SurA N-terminal domain-containing protein [Neptunomonas concharum]|uniref:Periplasmic chaperone PpiD n=1 Tax=Neptunomonas concharum TaxID=1031538 RepID=A0A5P1RB42_9GAMM|nr:SurA N-terminal domain-containing protein [Neptunomonas concharum]QEQ96506.1 peptidylprolyl isomerase [Neptunomonas concharum]